MNQKYEKKKIYSNNNFIGINSVLNTLKPNIKYCYLKNNTLNNTKTISFSKLNSTCSSFFKKKICNKENLSKSKYINTDKYFNSIAKVSFIVIIIYYNKTSANSKNYNAYNKSITSLNNTLSNNTLLCNKYRKFKNKEINLNSNFQIKYYINNNNINSNNSSIIIDNISTSINNTKKLKDRIVNINKSYIDNSYNNNINKSKILDNSTPINKSNINALNKNYKKLNKNDKSNIFDSSYYNIYGNKATSLRKNLNIFNTSIIFNNLNYNYSRKNNTKNNKPYYKFCLNVENAISKYSKGIISFCKLKNILINNRVNINDLHVSYN